MITYFSKRYDNFFYYDRTCILMKDPGQSPITTFFLQQKDVIIKISECCGFDHKRKCFTTVWKKENLLGRTVKKVYFLCVKNLIIGKLSFTRFNVQRYAKMSHRHLRLKRVENTWKVVNHFRNFCSTNYSTFLLLLRVSHSLFDIFELVISQILKDRNLKSLFIEKETF